MKEIWENIKDFEGLYQVSNLGKVRSLGKGTGHHKNKTSCLKGTINNYGYVMMTLYKNKEPHPFPLHRLVGFAFIPNDKCLPQINHKDVNKLNNIVGNLEWVTGSQNIKHSYGKGIHDKKGEKHHLSKLTNQDIIEIRRLRFLGQRVVEIAEMFNIGRGYIYKITNRKVWTHI